MPVPPRPSNGILSEPIDLDGPRRPRVQYPEVEATAGLKFSIRGQQVELCVVSLRGGLLLARTPSGRQQSQSLIKGGFVVDGRAVSLIAPRLQRTGPETVRTASGSSARPAAPAQVARASRLLVEGLHDAELIERVWGDDLRAVGVVVEPLHGADDLVAVVRAFGPGQGRRLGILLDHLVTGSKESRIAGQIDHPDVMITGHRFIDIWQAINPRVIGVAKWPVIPPGRPWKEGIIAALGSNESAAEFWRRLLRSLDDWTDLHSDLIGSVEQLIDFVTETD